MKYIIKGEEQEKEPVGIISVEMICGCPVFMISDDKGKKRGIGKLTNDGRLELFVSCDFPGIQTDEEGRILIYN